MALYACAFAILQTSIASDLLQVMIDHDPASVLTSWTARLCSIELFKRDLESDSAVNRTIAKS